jgi:hypothetical protein
MNIESLFLYFLPVIILTFFVRAFFRLRHPKATGSDAWFHLHASEEIRRNKHRMPKSLGGFLIRTPFDYPPLVHFILSFMSRGRRERLEPFFGSTVDTIQVIVLFLFTHYISGSYEIAFVSGILFSFFPLLVKVDARVFFLSPRPVGELFGSLAILFSLLFVWFNDIPSMILGMVFLSLVLLSSKFGSQAMIFIYVILAIILLNPYLLLILLGGYGIALLISLGHYLKVISGHVRHSRFYRRTLVHKHSWAKQISASGGAIATQEKVGPKALAVSLLKNPIFFALTHAPLIVIILIAGIMDFGAFSNEAVNLSLLAWVLASFIPVLVVSLRPLRFLGEAERYLEYGVIPLCALVPIILYELSSVGLWILLLVAFLWSMGLIWVNYRVSFKEFVSRPGDPEDLIEVLQRLNEIPSGNVLCVPITTSFALAYYTHHGTLFWGGNIPSEGFSSDDFNFIFKDEFPFPSEDLDALVARYGIRHILVWKQSLDRVPPGYYSNLDRYPKLIENHSFAIHMTAPAGETPQVS